MTFKKNLSQKLIGFVKTGDFLAFDLILGNYFKIQNVPTLACHVTLYIGMGK